MAGFKVETTMFLVFCFNSKEIPGLLKEVKNVVIYVIRICYVDQIQTDIQKFSNFDLFLFKNFRIVKSSFESLDIHVLFSQSYSIVFIRLQFPKNKVFHR